MIILFFVLFSCSSQKKISYNLNENSIKTFLPFYEKADLERKIQNETGKQELAQLYWYLGLRTKEIEAFIFSRSHGVACLQSETDTHKILKTGFCQNNLQTWLWLGDGLKPLPFFNKIMNRKRVRN